MEEPGKKKSFEEQEQERLKQKAEKEKRMSQIRVETRKWIESDPAVAEYLKPYAPISYEGFYDYYAHIKSSYLEYGENYGKSKERFELRHIEDARLALKAILSKKLYDLRRQWGADLIKLEGIDCYLDFVKVSEDLFSCSWLNPIKEEELDFFILFLEKSDLEKTRPGHDWGQHPVNYFSTDFSEEKNIDEHDTWMDFHNLHTQAHQYKLLPDLRGQKDQYYKDVFLNKKKLENEEKGIKPEPPTPYTPDPRPLLHFYEQEWLDAFVKKFETPQNLTRFRNYMSSKVESNEWPKEEIWLNEQLADSIFTDLLKLGHTLPIEGNSDWRKALYRVWLKYERDHLVRALRQVYDDYLFHIETGLPFAAPKDHDFYSEMIEVVKKNILQARALLGEPMNFDY